MYPNLTYLSKCESKRRRRRWGSLVLVGEKKKEKESMSYTSVVPIFVNTTNKGELLIIDIKKEY